MRKFEFSYDKHSDNLFLYDASSKSKGSIELGDLIIDYNVKKEIVGIQLINASKFLKDLVKGATGIKSLLSHLRACKVDVKTRHNLFIINILLQGQDKELAPVLSVPNIVKQSPALAQT
ncbi:DUF2283 domain-containing protein [Candidatus Woesearchaeota archaeon]|nr:DUF2283 domain-containing protein [Candidatus Woesearchaeota archaeon]